MKTTWCWVESSGRRSCMQYWAHLMRFWFKSPQSHCTTSNLWPSWLSLKNSLEGNENVNTSSCNKIHWSEFSLSLTHAHPPPPPTHTHTHSLSLSLSLTWAVGRTVALCQKPAETEGWWHTQADADADPVSPVPSAAWNELSPEHTHSN